MAVTDNDDPIMGVRTRYDRSTYVPALREDPAPVARVTVLPPVELPAAALDLSRPGPYTGHARSDDDAETIARADLLVSAAYGAAALVITVGLMGIAYIFRLAGEGFPTYVLLSLLAWGGMVLWSLHANRRTGLHNSPSGIAHHELDARERVAIHAIDVHAELLRRQLEGGRTHDHR